MFMWKKKQNNIFDNLIDTSENKTLAIGGEGEERNSPGIFKKENKN